MGSISFYCYISTENLTFTQLICNRTLNKVSLHMHTYIIYNMYNRVNIIRQGSALFIPHTRDGWIWYSVSLGEGGGIIYDNVFMERESLLLPATVSKGKIQIPSVHLRRVFISRFTLLCLL